MDKMKMRIAAMGGKAKEPPFGKEAMAKLHEKKQSGAMDSMLAELMGGEKEEQMEGGMEEIGELSPEETKLILAFRKKKAVM